MAHPDQLPSGNWRIRWIDEHGERHSEVFEGHDDAMFALQRHELEVKEIKRGLRIPTIPNKTFGELCDHWLEKRAAKKRSGKDDQSIIRRHLRPAFGHLQLRRLVADTECIETFIDEHPAHEKTIGNHLTLLISMLNLAKERRWIADVPKIRKPKFTPGDYRWLKTADEVRRFLVAAREEGDRAYYLYATAVNTGMRQGELAGLTWPDVDFDRRLITVKRSFDGPTKTKDIRHVPILDSLLPLLREWRLRCPASEQQSVFPNDAGRMHQPSARIFQEVLHAVLDRAEFPKVVRDGKKRNYIVFHDLRHTFASLWMMNGGNVFKLQEALGHKSIQTTMRYSHLAPDAFADEYGRLGQPSVVEPAVVLSLAESR